jgi:hypothetical protein
VFDGPGYKGTELQADGEFAVAYRRECFGVMLQRAQGLPTLETFLMASGRRGSYPHTDAGVEVGRILHRLRQSSIENRNEYFKTLFEAHWSVPTTGRRDTARFALGAVFVYQLALLHRHEQDSVTNRGLKIFLRAA